MKQVKVGRWAVAGVVLLGFVLVMTNVASGAFPTALVSRNSQGVAANGGSNATVPTAVSARGEQVAFQSRATNLPGGDGTTTQGYVRSFVNGKTRLVSRDGQGNPSTADVQMQGISADGRRVTFQTAGLPGSNGTLQTWVYDLGKRKLTLASRSPGGAPADAPAFDPSISANGRWVAFSSFASNLPGGSLPGTRVYVRDLKQRRTILVSRTGKRTAAIGSIYGQAISDDGRRIAFHSDDVRLPGGDGSTTHVYLRDLARGRTVLVDRSPAGELANGSSGNPSLSGDGRRVVFESSATNLPGQTGNQVYVRDLPGKRTLLAGRNSAGQPQDGYAEFAHLSRDGRRVQFVSAAENLPGGSAVNHPLVYVRDLPSGKTRLASRGPDGAVADGEATQGSISADGRWVVFDSPADNLGSGNPLYQNVFRTRPFR